MNFLAQKRKKTLLQNSSSAFEVPSPFDNFYYKEIAKLTAAGGWCINFVKKQSFLDTEGRRILKTPENYRLSLKNALDFYAPEHKDKAVEFYMACSNGQSFSTIIKMVTYEGDTFWAKATGAPVYNDDGQIIGIHGVFQDINDEKLREISLQKSVNVIESQNSRLFNFAHIVSHNLRSHASNLQLTLDLLNSIDNEAEEKELRNNLAAISKSLNKTVKDLDEVASAQSKSITEKKPVKFEVVLANVTNSISRIIQESQTEIYSDFSEVPEINYIPSYLNSIFLNLITNAIKYSHPDRDPVVDIYTYKENGENVLMIKDNGLGIDLDKYGKQVFNMYQTFHNREDSVGIGLFITKNQIETLQGSITVESTVNEGTTFTIRF